MLKIYLLIIKGLTGHMLNSLLQRQIGNVTRFDGVEIFPVAIFEASLTVLESTAFYLAFALFMFECTMNAICIVPCGWVCVTRA